MTIEEPLSTAERIRKRRELRDQQLNGGTPPVVDERQPRIILPEQATQDQHVAVEQLVVERVPAAEPLPPAIRRRVVTEPLQVIQPVVEDIPKSTEAPLTELPPVPDSRIERVTQQAANASQALILGLLDHMRAGEQLLITRDGLNVWSIILPTSVVGNYQIKMEPTGKPAVQRTVTQGRLPAKFYDSLMNPAYLNFQAKWHAMTDVQRLTHAKALNVTLPTAADPKIFNMNLMMLVQAAEGIDKWKPEYSTTAAREAAKDKALKGMPY